MAADEVAVAVGTAAAAAAARRGMAASEAAASARAGAAEGRRAVSGARDAHTKTKRSKWVGSRQARVREAAVREGAGGAVALPPGELIDAGEVHGGTSRPAIASVGPSTRLHVTFRWTKKFVYFPCGVSKPSALQERLRDTALR